MCNFNCNGCVLWAGICNKNQSGGNRTKTILLRGYPSVVFCTAGLQFDEQEATRFIILSPEINEDKIKQAIDQNISREADGTSFDKLLEANPFRALLKERILAIKQANIKDIKICSEDMIKERFYKIDKKLKPRHQRDIKKIISLIKSLALLNFMFRENEEGTITANEDDIEQGFKIWDDISVSQDLNISPYVYDIYNDVILPAFQEKNKTTNLGLTRKEVMGKHLQVYSRSISECFLRQQVLPMLENAGLIVQEKDEKDKRKILIYPIFGMKENKKAA